MGCAHDDPLSKKPYRIVMKTAEVVGYVILAALIVGFTVWVLKGKREGFIIVKPLSSHEASTERNTSGLAGPGGYSTLEPNYGQLGVSSEALDTVPSLEVAKGPSPVLESHSYDGCRTCDGWIPGTVPGTAYMQNTLVGCSSGPAKCGTGPSTGVASSNCDTVTLNRDEDEVGEQAVFTDRQTRRGIYRLAGLTRASPYGCTYGVDDANPDTGKPAKRCSVTDDAVMNGQCYRGNCLQDQAPSKVEKYYDRFEVRYPLGRERPALVPDTATPWETEL